MGLKAVASDIGSASHVTSVSASLPLNSSGGLTPIISILGLGTLGTAGQSIRMNAGATAMEYYAPVTSVGATAPLTTSGGATPTIAINGISGLGTALQIMGVNSGATAMEWVSSSGTGSVLRVVGSAPTTMNATGTYTNTAFSNVFGGATTPFAAAPLTILGGATNARGLIVSDSVTNSASKVGPVACGHYTNSEEPVLMIQCSAASATSTVRIGGGLSDWNAATTIRMYAAANNTTVTGTMVLDMGLTLLQLFPSVAGNIVLGTTAAGTSANRTMAFANGATSPSASTDLMHIYCKDISAGNAAFACYQESAPYAGAAVASTTKWPVIINDTTYYVLMTTVA